MSKELLEKSVFGKIVRFPQDSIISFEAELENAGSYQVYHFYLIGRVHIGDRIFEASRKFGCYNFEIPLEQETKIAKEITSFLERSYDTGKIETSSFLEFALETLRRILGKANVSDKHW